MVAQVRPDVRVGDPQAGELHALSRWRWHLDEVFVRINGVQHTLWRAVDHEGEVLEAYVSKHRDRKAALTFLRKLMTRHGPAEEVVTDGLRSYRAALTEPGAQNKHVTGRWKNNRVENSHLPFQRRERAMLRFQRMRSLQTFASVHSSVSNHFNSGRSLSSRSVYKQARTAALAKWRQLCAEQQTAQLPKLRLVRIRLTDPGLSLMCCFSIARRRVLTEAALALMAMLALQALDTHGRESVMAGLANLVVAWCRVRSCAY